MRDLERYFKALGDSNRLREAFKDDKALQRDTTRLKDAIAAGACTVSEWKPYSGVAKAVSDRTLSQ